MLLAVHLPASIVVPLALAGAGLLLAYWWRLGRGGVPPSRRRIRRTSIAITLVALPALVRGTSFLDPGAAPRAYIISWIIVLGAVMLVVILAAMDLLNNARLHHAERRDLLDGLAGSPSDRREGA